jgi:hypothetical protein
MSQTRSDVLTTLNVLVSDPNNQKWTATQKVHFINQALQDVVSSMSLSYIRTHDIALRDRNYEYEFPEDMLQLVAMMFQDIEGAIVMSSSWRSMITDSEYGYSGVPGSPEVFWNIPRNASGHITMRDLVSDNKFIFTPYYEAETYTTSQVKRSEDLPSSSSEGDIWVDQYQDENYVYTCDEAYSADADLATATLSSEYLPGTVDLVFTYDVPGIKHVQVVLVNAGATGSSSVAITGDADDRANPLTYTFTLYLNNNSNDDIIALAPTDLTIGGASATRGVMTATSVELENPAASKWTQQVLHLRYVAIFPKLTNDTDLLPAELPVLIREGDCLAYIAAAKLLDTMKGDERWVIMSRTYKKDSEEILNRCRKHRNGGGPAFDLSPG